MTRSAIIAAGCAVFALILALWFVPYTVRQVEADIGERATALASAVDPAIEIAVHHQQVTATGTMSSQTGQDTLIDSLSQLRGVTRVDDQIRIAAPLIAPTSYEFEARRTDDAVLLEGYILNDAQRASVVGMARQAFAPVRVVDRLKASPGAPPGYDAIVKLGLSHLARLDSGRFEFRQRRARLTGVAPDPSTRLEIESAIERVDQNRIALTTSLSVRPADGARREYCQRSYNRILSGGVVRFTTGSASISADSFDLLDALAAAAKECADVAVEVQGHTDSMGEEQANLLLSERRAQSVVDYLVREGVDDQMLGARGFGEQVPKQPNDTPSGRAANRRIEFAVRAPTPP